MSFYSEIGEGSETLYGLIFVKSMTFTSPENIIPVLLDKVNLLKRYLQLLACPGCILCILISLADTLLILNVPVSHKETQHFIS